MAVNAYQQHTIYFTESVKGQVKRHSQNGYVFGNTETTSAVMANTANALVSYPFGHKSATKLFTRNHFANTKIVVGINVTTAYDNVVAVLAVQGSSDGTNWVDLATAIADCEPDATGVKSGVVDLTDIWSSYFRLAFNSSGLNVGTSGKAKLFYSIPE